MFTNVKLFPITGFNSGENAKVENIIVFILGLQFYWQVVYMTKEVWEKFGSLVL